MATQIKRSKDQKIKRSKDQKIKSYALQTGWKSDGKGNFMTTQKNINKGIPVVFIVLMNLSLISIFSMLIHWDKSIAYFVCDLFLPVNIPKSPFGEHVAFKISVYIISMLISILFIPLILFFGISELKGRAYGVSRWKSGVFTMIFAPVVWIGYPLFALGKDYFATSNIAYILITSLAFSGVNLLFGIVRK